MPRDDDDIIRREITTRDDADVDPTEAVGGQRGTDVGKEERPRRRGPNVGLPYGDLPPPPEADDIRIPRPRRAPPPGPAPQGLPQDWLERLF
jgi:hypothetical protein